MFKKAISIFFVLLTIGSFISCDKNNTNDNKIDVSNKLNESDNNYIQEEDETSIEVANKDTSIYDNDESINSTTENTDANNQNNLTNSDSINNV